MLKKYPKKFSKNFQNIFKNFQKIQKISKIFKKYSKNFKKISKIFRIFLQIFLRKLLKIRYFSIIFSKFIMARCQFLRVWTKNAISKKTLSKFSEIFRKIVKMHYISSFRKMPETMQRFFALLDETDNVLEISRKFSKILTNFLQKIAKMHYFRIFFQKI